MTRNNLAIDNVANNCSLKSNSAGAAQLPEWCKDDWEADNEVLRDCDFPVVDYYVSAGIVFCALDLTPTES